MKIDFEIYTQQLNKAYNILAQQVVILNYMKDLITSNNDFDNNIISVTNSIETLREDLTNHINEINTINEWVDTIKEYLLYEQEDNQIEVGTSLYVDGIIYTNGIVSDEGSTFNGEVFFNYPSTFYDDASFEGNIECFGNLNASTIYGQYLYLGAYDYDNQFVQITTSSDSQSYHFNIIVDGVNFTKVYVDKQESNTIRGTNFTLGWDSSVINIPSGLYLKKNNKNVLTYNANQWKISNGTSDVMKNLSMVEHFVTIYDTTAAGDIISLKLITNENRSLTVTDIQDHLFQYVGGPTIWTPCVGNYDNDEIVGIMWNARENQGIILRTFEGRTINIPVSNLAIGSQSHNVIF